MTFMSMMSVYKHLTAAVTMVANGKVRQDGLRSCSLELHLKHVNEDFVCIRISKYETGSDSSVVFTW